MNYKCYITAYNGKTIENFGFEYQDAYPKIF